MPRAEIISSAANSLVKDVRRAVHRSGLTSEGLCVAESFHLLEEALASRREVRAVLATESALPRVEQLLRRAPSARLMVLAESLFQTVAATETSQGVIALVSPPAWGLDALFRDPSLLVVLDGVQDPGNAGAICRAAEAFGATGALFVKGTAGPMHPKTLRASAGSLFRLPFLHGKDADSVRAALAKRELDVWAAVPAHQAGALPLHEANLTRACAFLIGGEGAGVSADLRRAARDLFIPTHRVESLNAAMAAGILLYEASRQRGWHA
jgi:TrmH family RNA methyltransferase